MKTYKYCVDCEKIYKKTLFEICPKCKKKTSTLLIDEGEYGFEETK
jgi:RNA polymerase subunit RPABC4/transcription elongation factor Spt4